MTDELKPKVYLYGNWTKIHENKIELTEDGKLVAAWLKGANMAGLEDRVSSGRTFEDLLREEFKGQDYYRYQIQTEFSLLRNWLLAEAEAIIPDLSKPARTVVEAYNNGMLMGQHSIYVQAAQKISDVLDKIEIKEKAR